MHKKKKKKIPLSVIERFTCTQKTIVISQKSAKVNALLCAYIDVVKY